MKKLGFTLAEVLITLVIIGVIAAMTVPTLMQNTSGQEYRSAYKKAISTLNQALTLHYALTGNSAQDYSTGTLLRNNIFNKRMSVINPGQNQAFTLNVGGDCDTTARANVFSTADGAIFCITSTYTSANADGETSICNAYNTVPCVTGASKTKGAVNLWIDVNGKKAPNKNTTNSKRPKDIYQAMIYAQRVVPYGTVAQDIMFESNLDK